MAEILKQTLEQKLQQRLAPLQVQFVRLLEMNEPEVEEEVRREIDDNPALEVVDTDPDEARYEDPVPRYRLHINNSSPDDNQYEPLIAASGDTLQEILTRQLTEQGMDPQQLRIAEYIIGNIDSNGYLTRDLNLIVNDLAINAAIDTTRDEVRHVADAIRACDPAGVGAVDLRDCLLLQLKRVQEPDEVTRYATEIVADYFDLFSKKHYDRLRAAIGIDADKLREAIGVITSLNPKPGSGIGSDNNADAIQAVTPDFTVEVDADHVSVSLANSIPELRIEQSFRLDDPDAPVTGGRREREAQAFIRRKSEDASNFIKMLKMRQETLFKVMTAIVKLQRDFFTGGDDESLIRPMILKDVAARTGLDLSVISRATTGKWVATAHGVYSLKMFFNERVTDETDASAHEVLSALRAIIDNEDKRHPLSDEALTTRLSAQGYDIARRTVAKYRERLGLPVARLRREM